MECVESILAAMQPFVEDDIPLGDETEFPVFSEEVLNNLCTTAIEKMSDFKAIVDIPSPIVFVGDLHGNLHDLLRILRKFGMPPETRYIFLGDYVDRGQYSVGVISLILSMLCKWPENIYLLRGNHEFAHINRAYGFYQEIMLNYKSEELWVKFQEVFSYMHLAAIVQESVFCVHGGLSPLLTDIETLRTLPMPIANYLSNTMISDLVWSDPADFLTGFKPNPRGSGQMFGTDVMRAFLKANKLKVMIRAHQLTANGYRAFGDFMGITVFSSSNYCKQMTNKCGVVVLKDDREMAFFSVENDDMDAGPGAVMSLPMDGDVGLKRMFRAISKPDLRNIPANDDNIDEQAPAPAPVRRSQSVFGNLANMA